MRAHSLRCFLEIPFGFRAAALLIACFLAVPLDSQDEPREGDLLPDIVVPPIFLYDTVVERKGVRRLLNLSNGTANVGTGPLYLYGVLPSHADGTQTVRQRVFNEDGSFYDREAGRFQFHEDHQHIHFDDWAEYRLRRRVGDEGVGEIVAEGTKQTFCIIDLEVFNPTLPGFPVDPRFISCGSTTQGLSVGWVDVYDKSIEGQFIDITGVPDGHYWIESEVDPLDHVLESDESNNVALVPFTLGNPPDIGPDVYEPNDLPEAVRELKVGAPNSAHVGPSNPKFTHAGLTLDSSNDVDYFRFYSNDIGTGADFVRVDFDHARGNVDLELLDDDGATLEASSTDENFERISLKGRPEGWYYVRVFGRDGDLSPSYRVAINPPSNEPPVVEVRTPPEGGVAIRHALALFQVFWTASAPAGNEMWVTVYFFVISSS